MGARRTFILIAEDDADDRFLLKTAFEENGHDDKIEFVENGVELLNYLKKVESSNSVDSPYPGFIMLDLNMPKKDGREVLQEIKRHPIYKVIPVVVYTTTKNEAEVRKCYELGANSYIVKPARFDALLKTIDDLRNYWLITSSIPE
jgi:CheY-like chemotaxis protein